MQAPVLTLIHVSYMTVAPPPSTHFKRQLFLTHNSTHNRKNSYGNNGEDRIEKWQNPGTKGPDGAERTPLPSLSNIQYGLAKGIKPALFAQRAVSWMVGTFFRHMISSLSGFYAVQHGHIVWPCGKKGYVFVLVESIQCRFFSSCKVDIIKSFWNYGGIHIFWS